MRDSNQEWEDTNHGTTSCQANYRKLKTGEDRLEFHSWDTEFLIKNMVGTVSTCQSGGRSVTIGCIGLYCMPIIGDHVRYNNLNHHQAGDFGAGLSDGSTFRWKGVTQVPPTISFTVAVS